MLLFPEQQHGSWSLLMLCQDRQGLLAKLCGVLALHNLSVLAARIFTWPDGTVVDMLDLLPQAEISFAEQDWQRLDEWERREGEKRGKLRGRGVGCYLEVTEPVQEEMGGGIDLNGNRWFIPVATEGTPHAPNQQAR